MKDERMLQRSFFIFSMLMLTSMVSSAAEVSNKVSIFVSYAGKDRIGQQIAGLLEERIKTSLDYKMAPSHQAMMKVAISALSLNTHQPTGTGSAVSAIITMRNYLNYDPSNPQTWYPIFLGSHLVVISETKANEFASNILNNVDAALERYRQDVRKYQQDIF